MNLLKAASTVSLLTLASRITGLIREALIAGAFGASALTDAFNVAWRIPNLLRRLFGEGAFSQAFVPILAGTRERDGDTATHQLVDAVGTVLMWSLLATVVVGADEDHGYVNFAFYNVGDLEAAGVVAGVGRFVGGYGRVFAVGGDGFGGFVGGAATAGNQE